MGTAHWIMIVFAGLAAAMHILFFLMESVLWTKPAVMRIFRQSSADVMATRLMAFNQGFYNLFLAAGAVTGIAFTLAGNPAMGLVLIGANCAIMLGAAIVLLASAPKMYRGVIMQGLPPLVSLAALALG